MAFLDRDQLLDRCLGDAEFAEQMLDLFCTETATIVDHLIAAVEEGRTAGARRLAHAIKGSALTAGATRCAAAALAFETSPTPAHCDSLADLFHRTCDEIRTLPLLPLIPT